MPPWTIQFFNDQDKDKLKERLQDPPKQEELAHEQKDLAEKMQDHFDVSEMW